MSFHRPVQRFACRLLLIASALRLVPTAFAQQAADEDLEIPAAPATQPAQQAPAAAPASAAAPSTAAVDASGATRAQIEALETRNRDLESRLDALERAHATEVEAVKQAKADDGIAGTTAISGYVQAQYEASQLSEDQLQQGGGQLNLDRFAVRRARLRLDQTWRYAALVFEIDANTLRGLTVGARRAYGSVFLPGASAEDLPYASLALGLQDIPFGYELPFGSRKRVFMERSLASRALFPGEPDVGGSVSGGIGPFRYAVAVMNGQPIADSSNGVSVNDPNAAKDVIGRVGVEVAPQRWFTIAGGVSFLSGTGFHAGTDATKNQVRWSDKNEDSIFQVNEAVAAPGMAATRSKNFDRWATNADLQLGLRTSIGWSRLYGELTLASNLDRALFIADPYGADAQQNHDTRELGYYIAFLQEITPYAIIGFRTDFYDGNSDFTDSRRGNEVPAKRSVRTYSPLVGAVLPGRARLIFQYDFVRDALGRDARGVPADLRNDQWTLRLQVGI